MQVGQNDKLGKRQRGLNFSQEEELLLLSEVEKYRSVVECKLIDKVNLNKKHETWKKIAMGFNAKNVCNRNVEQLKVKYDNMKNKARKALAVSKLRPTNELARPPRIPTLSDPVMAKVLCFINKSTKNINSNTDNSNSKITDENITNEASLSTNFSSNSDTEYEDPLTIVKSELLEEEIEENCLQKDQVEEIQITDCIESVEPGPCFELSKNSNANFVPKSNSAWCKYKPKKYKVPIAKKLRLIEVYDKQRAIKEYYKKKTQLIEEEIKKKRLEQEEVLNKKIRDEEEHNKKMKLMDLEIEIKRNLLNNGKINS